METRQHLVEMKCTACRGGEPTLTPEEIERLLPEIPGWSVVEKEGIKRLQQTFKFKNFREALDFTNNVGQIAEEEGHHPSILTEWGRVTVTWWTHKIRDSIKMISSWQLRQAPFSQNLSPRKATDDKASLQVIFSSFSFFCFLIFLGNRE